jgi:hypothetical protein
METEIEIVEEANPPFNFGGSGSNQAEAALNSVDKFEKFDKNISGSVAGSHLLLFSDDDSLFCSQKKLWEAFCDKKEKLFDRCLEAGANPELVIDQETQLSTFELLCREPEAGEYILKCLDNKTDPNRVST